MYAKTTTGTAVKRLRNDVESVTAGNHLGVSMLPSTNLKVVTPMTTRRNTIANPTDITEIYLAESATEKQRIISLPY